MFCLAHNNLIYYPKKREQLKRESQENARLRNA